ncbi:hypothetical protein JCM10213_007186 [Rhodosporidiobolus nylandii]
MDKLPVEMLHRIADHLLSSVDRREGYTALFSLCRTSKDNYGALRPLLCRHVVLGTRAGAAKWATSYLGSPPPMLAKTPEQKAELEKLVLRSLTFANDGSETLRIRQERGHSSDVHRYYQNVPDLRPGVVSGHFAFLTRLAIQNFHVHSHILVELLGPFKVLRSQLHAL